MGQHVARHLGNCNTTAFVIILVCTYNANSIMSVTIQPSIFHAITDKMATNIISFTFTENLKLSYGVPSQRQVDTCFMFY